MKKLAILAGFAAALGLAVPAQAVPAKPAVQTGGAGLVELVHGKKHHHHRHHNQRHNAYRHYHHRPPVVHHYHHHQVRPWAHWRPYVVQHHYHGFGAPVYYSSHPHYGPYYRVRAHDRSNVALWLGISAITGAILFSQY